MVNESFFGNEKSPLRESPKFRLEMEKYKIIEKQIDEMEDRRGFLSYEEVMELSKLKKIRLTTKDEIIKWKNHTLKVS